MKNRIDVGAWIESSSRSDTLKLLTVRTSLAAGIFSREKEESCTFMMISSVVCKYWIALQRRSGRMEILFGAFSLLKRTELRVESKSRIRNTFRTSWRHSSSNDKLNSFSFCSTYRSTHSFGSNFHRDRCQMLDILKNRQNSFWINAIMEGTGTTIHHSISANRKYW